MPKTVLIILAAVVALIVIVVLTGMRYLRADDEDDFDDDSRVEHGRSRTRGAHPPADQHARPRQRHDDDIRDERNIQRSGARPVRAGAGHGGDRGADPRRQGRAGQDRGWRDDSMEMPRAGAGMSQNGRPSLPQREQRPARAGRAADLGDPAGPGTRPNRSQPPRSGRDRLTDSGELDFADRRDRDELDR